MEMTHRFIIEVLPEDLPQRELIEASYLELRKAHPDWDIIGNPGFFNRKGAWVKGGDAISGDIAESTDEYAVIKTVDEAVKSAKSAAGAAYVANPFD
jgi:hypothetical protein